MRIGIRMPLQVFAICLLFTTLSTAQESKLVDMLNRSPSQVNSIGYINTAFMHKLMADHKIPVLDYDNNVKEAWVVADLDTVRFTPRWEAGYAILRKPTSAAALAKTTGGYVDMIGAKKVVWTPRQSYLVPLENNRLGIIRPANRALLSGWLNERSGNAVSPYLLEQAKQPEEYLTLLIATDLTDTISPYLLAKRLKEFESLKTQDVQKTANLLASVRGVSIIVGRKSLAQCIVAVDFAESPQPLLPIANNILVEVLERNGAAASEFADWKAKVEGNKLSFMGPISEETLEGVLSIFTIRSQADSIVESGRQQERQAASQQDPVAAATKAYFDGVASVIDRVRKHHTKTTGARATWNDMQSRKIDEMGTLNVDPEMIDFGATVANLLRGNALTIRSNNIRGGQTKARQSLSGGGYYQRDAGYGTSFNGYRDPNTTVDYQRVTGAQVRGANYGDYKATLSKIDEMVGDMRRAMTAKHNIQF